MLSKKFLKTKCKVEFSLPAEGAVSVYLVGDFNGWNETNTPLEKKGKNFKVTLDLGLGQEYQFRYLVNGQWENDPTADRYVDNPFDSHNSIVSTYAE